MENNNELHESLVPETEQTKIDAEGTASQEIEQPTKGKFSKKKLFGIIGAIAAVVILVTSLGIGYYQFIYRVDVDPIGDLQFEVIGVDGEGSLRFDTTDLHHEDKNINTAFKLLQFDYEPKDFSNGDTVTISLRNNPKLFAEYKINPIKMSKTITIEGLIGLPKTWAEVPNQQTIIDASNEKAKTIFDGMYSAVNQYAKEKFGSSVEVSGSHSLRAVAYKTSGALECSSKGKDRESCGNAVLLYTGSPEASGGIYFTEDMESVYPVEWNQIHTTADGVLGEFAKSSYMSSKLSLIDLTFDETIKKLEEYGYTINWM